MKFMPGPPRIATVVFLYLAFIAPLVAGGMAWGASPSPTHASEAVNDSKPSSITPWTPRPVLGAQNTLVLLVQFQDVRFRSSITDIRSLVDHVDKWFRKSSYGKMYINYTIYEYLLTLSDRMSSYGVPKAGDQRGDDPTRSEKYVIDTLNLIMSQENVNLEGYQHVVLVHAGGDEAETGNPNEIWSHCDCVGPIADEDPSKEAPWVLSDSGKITHAFWGISTFSEDEPWAVFVHEFTHSLGVSDLYVYGSDGYSESPGIGFWSNMATGAFLDPPVDIDGWSKYILGWIDAVKVDSPQGEYTVHTLDSVQEPKALLIQIKGNADEYYFVHARRRADTDAALPSEGVLVFKVNRWREMSLAGEELAILYDANPDTPRECRNYQSQARELCRLLDAPYSVMGKQYQFTYYDLSAKLLLNNNGFWDENARIAFKVEATGDEAFKITLGSSPDEVGITSTTTSTTGTTEGGTQGCIIATAAYGSEMASEVVYMRFVRDKLIGSTSVGSTLVRGFNAFYYSWSPQIAKAIAPNFILRAIFRVLLVPLVWIVHVAAALYITVVQISGRADIASMVAFLLAAFMSVMCYVALPIFATKKFVDSMRTRRLNLPH